MPLGGPRGVSPALMPTSAGAQSRPYPNFNSSILQQGTMQSPSVNRSTPVLQQQGPYPNLMSAPGPGPQTTVAPGGQTRGPPFGPPVAMGNPYGTPPQIRTPGPPLQNNSLQPPGMAASRPNELPMPYDGVGQLSHQVVPRGGSYSSNMSQLTPSGSGS